MRVCIYNILIMVVVWGAGIAQAKTHRAFNDHLLGGDCQLKVDPSSSGARPWPVACFKAKAGSEIALRQNEEVSNLGLNFGEIYGGLHISQLFSLHAAATRRRAYFFESTSEVSTIKDEEITDSLFFQLGNKTLTRFSLAFGQTTMPFGIDHQPLMQIYRAAIKNNSYWDFPHYVGNLTFDNQVDSRIEVAVGSSEFLFGAERDTRNRRTASVTNQETEEIRESFAIRSNYDLSALEGTRISISLYEERHKPRRIGFGFLNQGANNSRSAFEWVRIGSIFKPDADFNQMFRLSHATGFRAQNRTVFEFELDHRNYRILTVGFDRRLAAQIAMFRTAVTYYWNDQEGVDNGDYLSLVLGVEARL